MANRETADQWCDNFGRQPKGSVCPFVGCQVFWENDLRVAKGDGLTAWTDRLSNVTFHNKLGSQKARIDRIASLAATLAPLSVRGRTGIFGGPSGQMRICPLKWSMNFLNCRGLMGRYYATAAGLPDAVAAACQDHYSPWVHQMMCQPRLFRLPLPWRINWTHWRGSGRLMKNRQGPKTVRLAPRGLRGDPFDFGK